MNINMDDTWVHTRISPNFKAVADEILLVEPRVNSNLCHNRQIRQFKIPKKDEGVPLLQVPRLISLIKFST